MAIMFPRKVATDTKSSAERKLYELLERDLSDEYVVFHSVAWLAHAKNGRAFDGETDFLIAHRDLGVLVLEVKGGRIEFNGKMGAWYSTDRYGNKHRLSKDPIEQAKDARYNLFRKLRDTQSTQRFSYPVFHAVCFPDVVVSEEFRIDAPIEIVFDKMRLRRLERAITSTFEFWRSNSTHGRGPGVEGINALIELLAPQIELRSYLALDFESEHEQIKTLTEQQISTLDLLSRERRAIIYGCAGSGKTLLALEKAKRLAHEGYSVLFTCFNNRLAEWVSTTPYASAGVTVSHFHKLCRDISRKARVTIPALESEVVEGDKDYYYDVILPQALLEASKHLTTKYDALIVDEGQDFRDGWWIALEELLTHPQESVFYIFADDNQNIYAGTEKGYPFTGPSITLNKNCRNTRQIHQLVTRYYQGELLINSQGPEGRPPEFVSLADPAHLLERLRVALHKLVNEENINPNDIVVLSGKSLQNSMLKEGTRLGNFVLSWNANSATEKGIHCSTIHSFKGLERPVVILAELDCLPTEERKTLTYIAVSRPRNHLIVLGDLPF